ncbi:hypothetical protein P168DRAFT_113912 [Aspergillus campestris IBT 28561]|uniref:Uncharacterized protein n=1 Tax=Aspergillus campestris (strain IBT 28561) TaxID=1392248 RepID=A0A2I1D9I0_ASPC2|nr:uncharacterized protein P168DRAFT_113912 [Aspergillus campestris IBT 28561]PKY06543.1 hypothetical protein P168DRAFT_113912 [Aspergillus campestris IBT 28561]
MNSAPCQVSFPLLVFSPGFFIAHHHSLSTSISPLRYHPPQPVVYHFFSFRFLFFSPPRLSSCQTRHAHLLTTPHIISYHIIYHTKLYIIAWVLDVKPRSLCLCLPIFSFVYTDFPSRDDSWNAYIIIIFYSTVLYTL